MKIQFHGYYLTLSKKEFDSRIGKTIYTINAYRFFENDRYGIYSIHECFEYLKDFTEERLRHEKSIRGSFTLTKSEVTLKPDTIYGNDIKLKILDSDKLYNSLTKSYLYFVSWSKHESMYNNGRHLIDEVLGLQDI